MNRRYRYRMSRHVKQVAQNLDEHQRNQLLQQFQPSDEEFKDPANFHEDPLSEEDHDIHPLPFLVHKYPSKLLLLTTSECPVFCRYCTRKRKTLKNQATAAIDFEALSQYLKSNRQINEVILSGGDPIMLPVSRLMNILQFLAEQPTVHYTRIHTRTATTQPSLWSRNLRANLHRFVDHNPTGYLSIVHHINTPFEITSKAEDVFRYLREQGIKQLNQSVLLKGINDDFDTLAALMKKVSMAGIIPYYLHQLDKVEGSSHFEVDIDTGKALIKQLRNHFPGHLIPRYVIDSKQGKTSLS